jgi:hypothetical protein
MRCRTADADAGKHEFWVDADDIEPSGFLAAMAPCDLLHEIGATVEAVR